MRQKNENPPIELPDGRKARFIPLNIESLDTVCFGCMFEDSDFCKIYADIIGECIDRNGCPGNNGIFTEIE